MTGENERNTEPSPNGRPPSEEAPAAWLSASIGDLSGLDFEAPIAESKSADSQELGSIFRAAAGDTEDTPAARVFRMASAAAGMMFKPKDRNEPFGAMIVFADGRRSPIPADFCGLPEAVLAALAEAAKHPTLKARLADLCWVLDRKKGKLASAAVAAYVEIVKQADIDLLAFRLDEESGALKHEARNLLKRALQISRAIGWDKPEAVAARDMATILRARAIQTGNSAAASWFSDLDLEFGISDPAVVGHELERLIGGLPPNADGHNIVSLWRLCARAFHYAKADNDKHRAQSAAAEQFVLMADKQPMAALAATFLSDAITELHGVPDKKERRKELRHRLVDVQAGIIDELSSFSYPLEVEDIAKAIEQAFSRPGLRDKLFVFAMFDQSPDPEQLAEEASRSIREHPLSSIFGVSHHDSEGKVTHRTEGTGFGDGADEAAIASHIAQHERVRRQIVVGGKIDVARQTIARDHFLSEDTFERILAYSPFVPNDLVRTFARGFVRFFQGDFISALYTLTPLLENSLRHVLKSHGHDVTVFDDASQLQQDRTISSLFEQMRSELDTILGKAITTDIENVFLKKPGPHLRHALAHGLLNDGDPYGHDAIYACWLTFRLSLLPLFPYRSQLHLPFDDEAPPEDATARARAENAHGESPS
jgi:hypothetical protein